MKKIIIIIAVILTSAVTAFSLTRNEQKAGIARNNADKAIIDSKANTAGTVNLATAD